MMCKFFGLCVFVCFEDEGKTFWQDGFWLKCFRLCYRFVSFRPMLFSHSFVLACFFKSIFIDCGRASFMYKYRVSFLRVMNVVKNLI